MCNGDSGADCSKDRASSIQTTAGMIEGCSQNQVLTLLGDLSGEIAILFGVCCVVLKDDPMTPLSEIVIVFGGVPGADCERTLPINNEDTISSSYACLL